MIWFLLIAGLALVLVGIWGGPRQKLRADKAARIPKDATVQQAWDILTSPVQYEDELIKIPDHRPFRIPRNDRKFYQGLAVGLGMGLVIAAFLSPFLPRQVETPQQVAVEPPTTKPEGTGQPEPAASGTKTGETAPPATQQNPATTGQGQPAAPPAPKPANITVTIAPGSSSHDVAATLKAAGAIADEQEFLKQVVASGVETSLKAGTYVIPSDATLDQVIQQVTQ